MHARVPDSVMYSRNAMPEHRPGVDAATGADGGRRV